MEIECNNMKCHNTFYFNEKKSWKFPSKRYYCIPCRKNPFIIRLKCDGCLEEFTPSVLTQKYCSGDCKVVLHNRRVYQCQHLKNKRVIICKLCNMEIPPIKKVYRRRICKPCRDLFLVRYNKIKSELKVMQLPHQKKYYTQCTLCKKSVSKRLYCSSECSKLASAIRKSGN